MKHLIKTTYPCLVKTNDDFVSLEANDTLECEDEDFVYIYPLTSFQIPFCINLTQKSNSRFYSFTKIEGHSVIILEEPPKVELTQKEILSVNGKPLKVFISPNNVTFESEHKIVSCKTNHPTKHYKTFSVGVFGCVLFENDFYAFSITKEKLFHFDGDEISFEKDTLFVTKKIHDFSNRVKNYEIKFNDGINVQNEVFSQDNYPKNLICFDFLQAIKCKNFASAINFLTEKLKNKIKNENLESFFGKIQNILPFSETEFIIITNNDKNYVKFELENEKICDISLDNL